MYKGKRYADEIEDKIVNGVGWIYVFSQLTSALDEAISNVGSTIGSDCPFPVDHHHSGGKNKFRLFEHFDTTGRAICTCNDQKARAGFSLLLDLGVAPDFSSLLSKLKKLLDNQTVEKTTFKRTAKEVDPFAAENTQEKVDWRRNCLNSVAKELLPFDSPDAHASRAYFEKRKIVLKEKSPAIRFHPNLSYSYVDHEKNVRRLQFPALVFFMSYPSGKPATLHRIYITSEGLKAPVPKGESVKKLMASAIKGNLPGCAIRLYDKPGSTLNVTEGAEVGLAVRSICDQSIWAAYSSSLLRSMEVPKERFSHVRIWADLDPLSPDSKKGGAGIKAALILEAKLLSEGFTVEILLPNVVLEADAEKGIDWEDIIVEHKLAEMPEKSLDNAIAALSAPNTTVDELRERLTPLLPVKRDVVIDQRIVKL